MTRLYNFFRFLYFFFSDQCPTKHRFYRLHWSKLDPTSSRVNSRAPLRHGRLAGWPGWPRWKWRPWWMTPLVFLSVCLWPVASQFTQLTQAPCALGSAPSGPGGACVACVAGSFCPDGWTLPLPCPPGSVLFPNDLSDKCHCIFLLKRFYFAWQVFFALPAWRFPQCARARRIAPPMRPARRCAPRPYPTRLWGPPLWSRARSLPS